MKTKSLFCALGFAGFLAVFAVGTADARPASFKKLAPQEQKRLPSGGETEVLLEKPALGPSSQRSANRGPASTRLGPVSVEVEREKRSIPRMGTLQQGFRYSDISLKFQ